MIKRVSIYPRVFVTVLMMVLLSTAEIGFSQDELGLRYDLAKGFGFTWETVELSARLRNTAKYGTPNSNVPSYDLTVSVLLDIRDRKGLVGMAAEYPRILEVLDGNGKSIQRIPDAAEAVRQHTEVRYVNVLENYAFVSKLKPSEVPIRLHLAPNSEAPSVLSRVHGYVYALYAEKVIKVDVPFEPVGRWVEVSPDLEILVNPTTPPPPGPVEYEPQEDRMAPRRPTAPLAVYTYKTCVQSKTSKSVRALGDQLKDGQFFGPYAVVRTQLSDAEGNTFTFDEQWSRGEDFDGTGAYRTYCRGERRAVNNDYDTIRHVIAVNVREVKIPFTLTNVPVPSLAARR